MSTALTAPLAAMAAPRPVGYRRKLDVTAGAFASYQEGSGVSWADVESDMYCRQANTSRRPRGGRTAVPRKPELGGLDLAEFALQMDVVTPVSITEPCATMVGALFGQLRSADAIGYGYRPQHDDTVVRATAAARFDDEQLFREVNGALQLSPLCRLQEAQRVLGWENVQIEGAPIATGPLTDVFAGQLLHNDLERNTTRRWNINIEVLRSSTGFVERQHFWSRVGELLGEPDQPLPSKIVVAAHGDAPMLAVISGDKAALVTLAPSGRRVSVSTWLGAMSTAEEESQTAEICLQDA